MAERVTLRAPRGGWLLACSASLALLLLASALSSGPLDTLTIDVRHRLVAAVTPPPTASAAQPEIQPAVGGPGTQPAAAAPATLGPGPQPSVAAPATQLAATEPSGITAWAADAVGGGVGVNVFLEQEVEPAKRQRSLELLRTAGVGWVRQQLPWEQVEPIAKGETTDPHFGDSTWAKFDDIVERANVLGLKLILRVDTSPRWALPPDAADGLGPPVHDADYWDFVGQVATRYRGKVAAYQVWNEPNLNSEWGRQPPDAVAYARLLSGANERIKAADPSARVLMAALAPTRTENADALNELVYLQQLYDAGVRGSFDALAVQAYGLRGGPDDPRVDPADVTFSRPLLVRQVMERNGDSGTPVWATEMGWNANPADLPIQSYGRVTPSLQARYTVRAIERVREQWPWMQVVCIWYWKRPDETNRNQDWFWFRLADPDFTLQPVYYALRDAALTGWR